jgi:hypothetical protein
MQSRVESLSFIKRNSLENQSYFLSRKGSEFQGAINNNFSGSTLNNNNLNNNNNINLLNWR